MLKEELGYLIKLTLDKNYLKIKDILEECNSTRKGTILEQYIVELFRGNGWLTAYNGGKNDGGADILLFHPKQPNKVSIIIQVKNHNRPLSFDDTKVELIKFEEKSKTMYECNYYMLISINGFVRSAKQLEEFNMRLENWNYIENLITQYRLSTVQPDIELYSYNKISYENSKRLLNNSNKVAFIQATGTGKSYIIVKYLSDYIDKKSIVLAPQKYILEQTKEKCLWASENTIYMTYAKLMYYINEKNIDLKFDLIVLDEFHRCGAKKWGEGVEKLLNNNEKGLIIGTSATPIRYSDNERDMSDELFKNNIAVNLSLSEAIVKNIVPMPTYVTSVYNIDEDAELLITKINNSNISEEDKYEINRELYVYKKNWEKAYGIPNILNKYIKSYENKFIVFCEDKQHLYEMEWLVDKWFRKAKLGNKIRRYRVVSDDNDSDKELNEFKKGNDKYTIYLLFCINMLNEGIHIDEVSGVILLRTTKSPRIFYQQIGRAIKSGNTEKPIIFDFVNNFNNICGNDFLKELEVSKAKEKDKRIKLGLSDNSPVFNIIDESKDTIEFFKNIETKIKDIWSYRFQQLEAYYNENGNCLTTKENDRDLSDWCGRQRTKYFNGELIEEQIEKLNSISFVWDLNEYKWLQMYYKLKEYKKIHGNCIVSRFYSDSKLASWVVTQRRRTFLTQKREDMLNRLDFEWGRDEMWLIGYNELKKFKEKFGNFEIPTNYKSEDGFNLQLWAQTQRRRYIEYGGRRPLSDEEIKMLKDLGFSITKDEKWEQMFMQYIEFKNKTGKITVGRQENMKLACWVARQRKKYREGNLTELQINKLQDSGMINNIE